MCLPKVKFRFARNCQPSNDNVNTPNQTQSELRKQVETSLNKKKIIIIIDLSYVVGVNVVFEVFSQE